MMTMMMMMMMKKKTKTKMKPSLMTNLQIDVYVDKDKLNDEE